MTGPVSATEYMGFWIRLAATIIDYLIITVAIVILRFLVQAVFSYLLMLQFLLPWLYYWLFVGISGQTPGKMVVGIKVVNAQGNIPGLGCAALREILGKLLSTIALYLGFIWIALDSNKQSWHDKIADTYVVKSGPNK
jgi:uncharacterized RDD family membrane protein YckC